MGLISFIKSTSNENNLDVSKWAKFSLQSLFEIVLSKGDNQAKLLEEGTIPLVSAGNFNNGICKFIKSADPKSEIFSGNAITVDMFGKAFYQAKDFYAVSHGRVNILIPKFKMGKGVALFICTVLNKKFNGKYSFSTMCSQSKLLKESICLPVKADGNPNVEYMEKYMNQLYSYMFELIN